MSAWFGSAWFGRWFGAWFGDNGSTPVVVTSNTILHGEIEDIALTSDAFWLTLPADVTDVSLMADISSQGGIYGVEPTVQVPRQRMTCCDQELMEPCVTVDGDPICVDICINMLEDHEC